MPWQPAGPFSPCFPKYYLMLPLTTRSLTASMLKACVVRRIWSRLLRWIKSHIELSHEFCSTLGSVYFTNTLILMILVDASSITHEKLSELIIVREKISVPEVNFILLGNYFQTDFASFAIGDVLTKKLFPVTRYEHCTMRPAFVIKFQDQRAFIYLQLPLCGNIFLWQGLELYSWE